MSDQPSSHVGSEPQPPIIAISGTSMYLLAAYSTKDLFDHLRLDAEGRRGDSPDYARDEPIPELMFFDSLARRLAPKLDANLSIVGLEVVDQDPLEDWLRGRIDAVLGQAHRRLSAHATAKAHHDRARFDGLTMKEIADELTDDIYVDHRGDNPGTALHRCVAHGKCG